MARRRNTFNIKKCELCGCIGTKKPRCGCKCHKHVRLAFEGVYNVRRGF